MKLTEHFPAHKVDRSGGITPSHEDAPADAAPGGPVRTAAPDDGFLPHVAARAALRAVGGGAAAPGDVHPDLTAEREAETRAGGVLSMPRPAIAPPFARTRVGWASKHAGRRRRAATAPERKLCRVGPNSETWPKSLTA